MSDEEEDFMTDSESGGGDFSASEDEWVPGGKNNATAQQSSSSSDDDDDFEDVTSSSGSKKPPHQKATKRSNAQKPRSVPPTKKKLVAMPPTRKKTDDDDSEESSGDDCLVDPSKLDFNSDFFAASTSKAPNVSVTAPRAAQRRLSDAEHGDIAASSSVRSFQENELFIRNLERAKTELLQANANADAKNAPSSAATNAALDIQKLLQLGETGNSTAAAPKPKTASKKRPGAADLNHSDNSDWEEVAESKSSMRSGDAVVSIRVGPEIKPKPNRTQLELEAQLKRALNRRRKETQLLAHKVHILCWMGHGNYVNAVLNEPGLMRMCLKFMPSKYTYPKERTDRAYFEQITKWYASQMKLKHTKPDAPLSRLPPLPVSLALQIQAQEAICKKSFVQIFILLLRAIGVPCRLVLNLATMPLRPPSSELCSLSSKAKAEQEDGVKHEAKNEASSSSKKITNHTEKVPLEKRKADKSAASSSSKKITNHTEKVPLEKRKADKSAACSSKKATNHTEKESLEMRKADKSTTPQPVARTKGAVESKRTNQSARAEKPLPTTSSPHFATAKSTVSQPKKSSSINETAHPKKTANKPPETVSPYFKSNAKSTPSHSQKSSSTVDDKKPTSHHPSKAPKTSSACDTRKRAHAGTSRNAPSAADATESPLFRKSSTASNAVLAPALSFSSPVAKRTRSRPQRDAALPRQPPQLDGAHDDAPSKVRQRRKAATTNTKRSTKTEEASDEEYTTPTDDSDFECVPPAKKKPTPKAATKPTAKTAKSKSKAHKKPADASIDRRLLSSDDEDGDEKQTTNAGMNMWVELYSEAEDQWMCIDLFKQKVHCVDVIRAAATKPLRYVFAWSEERTVRDVSARYCTNWNTTTRRQRVEADWLLTALRRYLPRPTIRTRTEDLELDRLHEREPLPTTIGEFKNHPLYALQRHLLKFEGLYPPDAPALGFIRGEQVYARECVHTLHSRDIWLKSALVVRPGETAYKVVKARPRWDPRTNRCLEPQPLEIFGHWQTQAYDPPTAENGVVPRNAYGNVELFKPEMLPKKTRHLQLPGLNRTCKKLKIDCAQAVVGFDFHSGSCHPTFDGFVVCEEFAEQAVEQYWLDQEEAQRREKEKYETRVYGNWKRLIKGLLIRQRLQRKYNFADVGAGGDPKPTEEKAKSKGRRK